MIAAMVLVLLSDSHERMREALREKGPLQQERRQVRRTSSSRVKVGCTNLILHTSHCHHSHSRSHAQAVVFHANKVVTSSPDFAPGHASTAVAAPRTPASTPADPKALPTKGLDRLASLRSCSSIPASPLPASFLPLRSEPKSTCDERAADRIWGRDHHREGRPFRRRWVRRVR